jgi:LacI family transcriptional regulator
MRRPNINDVAKEANVSTATVSHVMNNTRFVSADLKKRVMLSIEKLGYIPSHSAKSLVTKSTYIIGVVFSQIINPFYTSVFEGIEAEMFENDIGIILASTQENLNKQEAILKTLISRSVDGIIIAPVSASPMIKRIAELNIPLVSFDRSLPSGKCVVLNNEEMAYQLTNHLILDGHNHIGLITGDIRIETSKDRLKGYKRSLSENNIDLDDQMIYFGDSLKQGGYLGAKKLLDTNKKITAMISMNNLTTIGVLKYFSENRIKCPDEIAFAGFDYSEIADLYSPPITYVRQPTYEMGRMMAKMLISEMQESYIEKNEENMIFFPGELIIGGSCSIQCYERLKNE